MRFGSFKENMEVVYNLFSRELRTGKLEAFELGMYEGALTMDSHSRYFTERRLAPQETHTDIPATIDPNGILNNLRTQKFIYGPDNHVDFIYSRKEGDERMYVTIHISMITLTVSLRMKKDSPIIFKLGDIVEVVAALVCVPMMGQRYKLLLKLRGLTLLDTSMRPVSSIQSIQTVTHLKTIFLVDDHIKWDSYVNGIDIYVMCGVHTN